MSRAENQSPTRRYVNCWLISNSRRGSATHRLRKSRGLPVLEPFPTVSPPAFEQFRNRLKVMADLDPVRYATPKPGRFEVVIDFEEEAGMTEATFMVHVLFDDASDDPAVELRMEPLSSVFHAGGNPCLY